MNASVFHPIHNAQSIELKHLPPVSFELFREALLSSVRNGARLGALFAVPLENANARFYLYAVLAHDDDGTLAVGRAAIQSSYPSLTPDCPGAHWFERELAEEHQIEPVGHPWLKPIRFQSTLTMEHDLFGRGPGDPHTVGITQFFQMKGDEIHEVSVGPVHAGIIEPGHFRFQCYGERVHHLEISLGYQHRGIKRALKGGPHPISIHQMETAAGDTTIGHTTAYAQTLEALAGVEPPLRAQAIRGVALELERLANHTGDLGALASDIGYLPTSSYCGRIRGDFLNMTAILCGNRFGRSLVTPFGIGHDLGTLHVEELERRLEQGGKDVTVAVNLLWETPSVRARFDETGRLTREQANAMGLVGPAARASGIDRDIRRDHPSGIFRFAHIPISVWESGDVFARAYVRWLEIQESLVFAKEQLRMLPSGPLHSPEKPLRPERLAVSLVEGWRGEICHVAITNAGGRLEQYHLLDPSFHNWFGLAQAIRGQQISDFPLCNKSFNLSYCGHDL